MLDLGVIEPNRRTGDARDRRFDSIGGCEHLIGKPIAREELNIVFMRFCGSQNRDSTLEVLKLRTKSIAFEP
jgi:hypothetical protein